MKKLICVLLIIASFFSTITTTFAADLGKEYYTIPVTYSDNTDTEESLELMIKNNHVYVDAKKLIERFGFNNAKNIDIVRRIRNEFESLGQNPIAFHLRCLDENYPNRDEELWSLIYREIDAREWFVYCQSPEAIASDNVQKERAYICHTGKDKVWVIDITKDWETIQNKIHRIVSDLEVFISYTKEDKAVASVLKKVIEEADYAVWDPEYGEINSAEREIMIGDAILRCAYKVFYILIISENSLRNNYVESELEFATNQGAEIIPVIVGNPAIPDWMVTWLGRCHKCTEVPKEEEFKDILKGLDSVMKKKIQNMNDQNS